MRARLLLLLLPALLLAASLCLAAPRDFAGSIAFGPDRNPFRPVVVNKPENPGATLVMPVAP